MKSNKSKKFKSISFDEEIVPKHVAEEILAKNKETNTVNIRKNSKFKTKKKKQEEIKEDISENCNKKKRKLTETSQEYDSLKMKPEKQKHIDYPESSVSHEDNQEIPDKFSKKGKKGSKQDNSTELVMDQEEQRKSEKTSTKQKKRKQVPSTPSEKDGVEEEETESNVNPPTEDKKKESIRSLKRKRHEKLLEEKKIKAELQMQQKSLNYLSKWKHDREGWKFEKLRQIWLQHNMYDSAKIPHEFWEVLLEYFSSARGKVRDVILKNAVKIVEECAEIEDESVDEMKVQRARDIVQNLQE